MTTINKLTRTDIVSAGDVVPVYVQNEGDARGAALSVLQAFMQNNLTFPVIPPYTGISQYTTQYASPSSNGFSVAVTNSSVNTHLILTPTAGFSGGTIILPSLTNAIDKQTVLVNCTQAVSVLTINGNGATAVTGAPSTLLANDSFLLMYDIVSHTWYQVASTQDNYSAAVIAFLALPSSVNLRAAVTDETGTGVLVFNTSPALITPALGAASADSLQRGAVVTKTISFTLAATENWVICNGSATIIATLPAAASFPGREIMLKTIAAFTVVSASSNIIPLVGGAAGTAILAATAGKYATLVSDGANWVIMAAN